MAIFKTVNEKGKYRDLEARETVARYIFNPRKALSKLWGGVCVTEDVVGSMDEIAKKFNKTEGVQLRHFVVAFRPEEVNKPEIANEIACELARFIGREYQVAFAIHEDTEYLHIHFMQNSISYVDGHRYYGTRKEYYNLLNFATNFLWNNYRIKLVSKPANSNDDLP